MLREVMVNAHHFADMVCEYLAAKQNFGMRIEVSREETLLDTGGGLKKAAWFFESDNEPFLLHNVDVVSTIDLRRMLEFHRERGALATLAVQQRKTSRYLLFDERLELCGRRSEGKDEIAKHGGQLLALGFCGIHVISPRLLGMMEEDGVFSIIETYLNLARRAEKIVGFRADEYYWRDLGRPEHLELAAAELKARSLV